MGLPGADSGKVNFQVLLALRDPVPQGKSSEECGGARPAVRGKVHKGWFKYPMGSEGITAVSSSGINPEREIYKYFQIGQSKI